MSHAVAATECVAARAVLDRSAVEGIVAAATAVAPRRWQRTGETELTDRELQVLTFASEGYANHEIAAKLYLSEDTVKSHNRRAFRKLGVRDRTQAVAVLYELGILGAGGARVSSVAPEPPRVTVEVRVGPMVTRGQLEALSELALKRAVGELEPDQQRMFRERVTENLVADFRAAGLLVEGSPP